jgi:hypothetical protein
MLHH